MSETAHGAEIAAVCERIGEALDPERVVELTRRLVALNTITGNEGALAPLLAELVTGAGLEARTEEFAPGRTNVYGHRRGGEGPSVLLVGHTDTVSVGGWAQAWGDDERADPFAGCLIDGELWGLGSADEKGGIAASLAALELLERVGEQPAGDVIVAFLGDEESGEPGMGRSAGAQALVAEIASGRLPRPDFAIYTEPTNVDVYAAQPGFYIATIAVQGTGSYFAYPWRGRSAIRDATRVLEDLEAYEAELWARRRHPSVGHALLVVTGIHGGESVAVPDRCVIELIVTVLPGETLDAARRELEERLQRLALERGIRTEIAFTAARNHPVGGTPVETEPRAPLVQWLAACASGDGPAAVGAAPYWSELPLLAEIGIPGVYCGPGDISVCHTPRERVPVRDLTRLTRALATFLATAPAASSVQHQPATKEGQ